MSEKFIPFNKPYMTGEELKNIQKAHHQLALAGDGPFTKLCHTWLENNTKSNKALLTHSCTAALEMTALLLNLEKGDEVIMPSYTFVSTANAFVLRGAKPVFVDIRKDTLNIDEKLIEEAITPNTKAIVVVHYAGISCHMDEIISISKKHHIPVIEDAAQGIMSFYKGKALGSMGDFGTFSFHETKNIISGEGGALLLNKKAHMNQAEIIREKGTNRNQFFRGEVSKYTWQDKGSSFLPGELTAAFLWAQLNKAKEITETRLKTWNHYHNLFKDLNLSKDIQLPHVPSFSRHNGHIFYLLFENETVRNNIIQELKAKEINSVFHYIPLHLSPAGQRFSKNGSDLQVTETTYSRLLRLPLWVGLKESSQEFIFDIIKKSL